MRRDSRGFGHPVCPVEYVCDCTAHLNYKQWAYRICTPHALDHALAHHTFPNYFDHNAHRKIKGEPLLDLNLASLLPATLPCHARCQPPQSLTNPWMNCGRRGQKKAIWASPAGDHVREGEKKIEDRKIERD